jgi:type 1 fimbria pilin
MRLAGLQCEFSVRLIDAERILLLVIFHCLNVMFFKKKELFFMKISNAIILGTALVLGSSGIAQADDVETGAPVAPITSTGDQGRGKITFTGSIIDAPCSIAPESSDQTVNLGQISNVALKNGGKSVPRDFSIKLEQCDIATLKTVTTTFSGSASKSNPDLLGIVGTASGASIAITDMGSNPIKLGEATTSKTLSNGNNTLHYSAYLQGDSGDSAKITPGEFSGIADFTLAYQ